MFVEVAVVLPLPTHSRSSWGPRMLRAFRAQSLNLINVAVHIAMTNQSLIRVVVFKIQRSRFGCAPLGAPEKFVTFLGEEEVRRPQRA